MGVPYELLRKKYSEPGTFIIPYRFYKNDGSGPFYSILLNNDFGISATLLKNVPSAKVAELDKFHRELQLLKVKYNTLSLYLTDLSKKQLKPVQQQSFNEGSLMLNNLREEMRKIKGVDVTYTSSGQIGEPITLLTILLISIIAAAISWTVITITQEVAKVKKINAAFDMQKWISDQKLKLATAKTAGAITQGDYNEQIKSLDKAAELAGSVVTANSKGEPGIFDKIQNLLLIGLGGYAFIQFTKK